MSHFIDMKITEGDVIRMAFLMTHYRSKMEIGESKLKEARKVLRRFALASAPSLDLPPAEIIEAVADDLNTPKAVSIMHRYRKGGEGRKLFAALRFLGFFEQSNGMAELKTYPDGSVFGNGYVLAEDRPEVDQ